MGRKQQKKRTFGKKRKEKKTVKTDVSAPSDTTSTPTKTTFNKYEYVTQDLKKIGISVGVILVLYALIFIINNSLNLF